MEMHILHKKGLFIIYCMRFKPYFFSIEFHMLKALNDELADPVNTELSFKKKIYCHNIYGNEPLSSFLVYFIPFFVCVSETYHLNIQANKE